MRLRYNSVTLDQIVGGTLASGTVPHPRLWRADQGAFNAGIVTITAAEVTVLTLGTFGLVAGDRLLVFVQVLAAKGGAAGLNFLAVKKLAGTADVNWSWGDTQAFEQSWVLAGEPKGSNFCAIGNCTVTGTCTVGVTGTSGGSDSTVAIGSARAHFIQFAGS